MTRVFERGGWLEYPDTDEEIAAIVAEVKKRQLAHTREMQELYSNKHPPTGIMFNQDEDLDNGFSDWMVEVNWHEAH